MKKGEIAGIALLGLGALGFGVMGNAMYDSHQESQTYDEISAERYELEDQLENLEVNTTAHIGTEASIEALDTEADQTLDNNETALGIALIAFTGAVGSGIMGSFVYAYGRAEAEPNQQ